MKTAVHLLILAVVLCMVTVASLHAQVVNDGATATLSNVTNTITGTVTVGTNGSFTLLVLSDNALLTNSAHGVIGRNATAQSNEVQLLSATARWLIGNNLFVGSNGAFNRLVVSNGALVNNNDGLLGNGAASSNNLALVTGGGSLWTNRTDLTVGVSGRDNQLIVSNGARVVSRVGTVGSQPGSSNNLVVVTGNGSSWTNHLYLNLGVSERGNRLVIADGGQVGGEDVRVGAGSGNQEALVTGPGSLLSSRIDLAVGLNPSNNRLVVSNGAAVVAGNNGRLGAVTGATNNVVVVTGAGSMWSNRFELYVGEAGPGNRMEVNDGGRVVSSNTYVGYFGASNFALVTGAGSLWSNRAGIYVGHSSSANQLVVSNGGSVASQSGFVGNNASGNNNLALITGSGSTWSNQADVLVGPSSARNSLVMSGGGTVINSNGYVGGVTAADVAAHSNTVVVTGPGSMWQNWADLFVGFAGRSNRMVVSNGGFVSSLVGEVGSQPTATNNVAWVTGAGSVWSNAIALNVGTFGPGNQLVVSNGGAVFTKSGFIGRNGDSANNFALVTGAGSVWDAMDSLFVGDAGSASRLVVSNAGRIVDATGNIGTTSHSNTATVTGAGSLWSNRFELRVGNLGSANRLEVQAGATVFGSNVFVGLNSASANNRVTVDGGTLRASDGAGTGVLDVRRGTNVLNAGLIDVDRLLLTNSAGRFELLGGTLVTRGARVNNGLPMVIGPAGASPAVWDVRPGAFDHIVTPVVMVGNSSSGNQLLVSGGALLTNGSGAFIGNGAGASSNTAFVSGTGSRWQVSGDVGVGTGGAFNRLMVDNGGWVATTSGRVGASSVASSNNVASVTGGAVWSNATYLGIGEASPGNQLQISGGGLVVAGSGSVGQGLTSSDNTAQVSDAGSEWRVTGNLDVGTGGSFDRLVVGPGGLVSDFNGNIGNGEGINNAAVVAGAGARWSNAGALSVGVVGAGSQLVVSNGGVVTASTGGLGGVSGNNLAVVTGGGSAWTLSGSLNVGSAGAANRLEVRSGGLLANGTGAIGFSSASNQVEVTGAGSLWSNQMNLIVGDLGSRNQLLVSDSGTVFTGGDGQIGAGAAARSNTVTAAGAGSRWLITSNLSVGRLGSFNRLVVSNGGFVSDFNGFVGFESNASNNVALVTGAGSVWSNADFVSVGESGFGNQLVVSNGGALIAASGLIGRLSGSDNNLALVTGPGSVWDASDLLFVGGAGTASRLVISNAGRIVDATGHIGSFSHNNIATVTGAGSLWSNRVELRVGSFGSANRLEVQAGATVFGSNVFVGRNDLSTNNRVVVDGGTLRAANPAGTSVLDVRRGTNVLNAGLVDVDQLVLTNKAVIPSLIVFGNGSTNSIPVLGTATPYPSTIAVAGLAGSVTKVTVTLSNLTYQFPEDLDILLVSPAGQKVMLMSDAGGFFEVANVGLTFDDTAATVLPDSTAIATGTYRPTDYEPGETMPGPAPAGPYSTSLSSFNGSNPNGDWSLYINADTALTVSGGKLRGWSVQIANDAGPFLDDPAKFEFNGGTLVTRGAVIDNQVPFVVGGPGGLPAVWDVRPSVSGHFVASDLIVGSLPAASSNNLLHVTGGTLRVLTPGTALDVRGGTNRLDAGLVDVLHLVVTNTRGQFEFNGGTLRTPDTTIANGRVFTVGNGLSLATLQLLGGTHSFANNLVVANNASLIGSADIDGTVTVSAGGRLVPGAPIGRIDVLGTVILQGAANLQIDKSGGLLTNDQVTATGAIFYDGTLNVTDIGTDVLAAGDRFFLFDATPYVGAFTTLSLPPLVPGLAWMNNLSVDGSIEVIAAGGQPGFASIIRSGTNVVFAGTNGTPGANYAVLASTNVALPVANWVSIATNQFNGSGGFSFTNAIVPGIPQRFFLLRTP